MLHTESLIIGSSRTAIILAKTLLALGKKVVMVEQSDFGGTYLNTLEYPLSQLFEKIDNYTLAQNIFNNTGDNRKKYTEYRNSFFKDIRESIKEESDTLLSQLQAYSNFKIISGRAVFTSDSLIEINSSSQRHLITFDECFLCTGMNALMPPRIMGLSKINYLHQENLLKLQNWPSSLIFNKVNKENLTLVYNLAKLGVDVHAIFTNKIHKDLGIGKDMAEYIRSELKLLGVAIYENKKITKVIKEGSKVKASFNSSQSILASNIYITLKESYVDDEMGLEKAKIKFSDKGIKTSIGGKTKNPKVRVFGSCQDADTVFIKKSFWSYINDLNVNKRFNFGFNGTDIEFTSFQFENYYFSAGLDYKSAVDKYGPGIGVYALDFEPNCKLWIVYKPENKLVLGITSIGQIWKEKAALLALSIEHRWNIEQLLNTLKY